MTEAAFSLYLITDRSVAGGADNLIGAVEEALKGGVRAVQLREKDLSARERLTLARRLKELAGRFNAKLFVNGRSDIALLSEADGVHLTQASYSPRDARIMLGGGSLIGASAHSVEEALRAEAEGADFITFGPVYHTPSKAAYGPPVGVGLLKEASKAVRIPVYAIGGIKKENIKEVISGGASGAAVISAILASKDIRKSAEELIEELERAASH